MRGIKELLKDPNTNWRYITLLVVLTLVVISGIWLYQLKYKFEKPIITEIPKREDEFRDWETYRDEEYGFELKYPQNWRLEENIDPANKSKRGFEKEISFISPLEWEISVPPEYKRETLSFAVTFTVFKKSKWRAMTSGEAMNPCEKKGAYCREIIFGDNISAFSWESVTDVAYHLTIYTPKEQFFIFIHSISPERPSISPGTSSPRQIEDFNRILSTFKFID